MTEMGWRWVLEQLKVVQSNRIVVPRHHYLQVSFAGGTGTPSSAGIGGQVVIHANSEARLEHGFLIQKGFDSVKQPYTTYVDMTAITAITLQKFSG